MKTHDIGVLDDVVQSRSNEPRVWLRRFVLCLIGATLVASVVGLTDQERSAKTEIDGDKYLVTYPKTVHAGTQAEITIEPDPNNTTPTMSACVSTTVLEVFETYTVLPIPRSTANCDDGIEWTFATKDVLSHGEATISGTVSDSSAYQIHGTLFIRSSKIPVQIWRIP